MIYCLSLALAPLLRKHQSAVRVDTPSSPLWMDFIVLMDFNHEGHACRINTWQKKLAATSITVGTIIIIALIIWCAMVGVQKTEELLPGPWKYEAPSTPPSMTQENGKLESLVDDIE